jgi:hypothetical protein
MKSQTVRILAVIAMLAAAMFGQNFQRQATMVRGGSPDRGKCTIEVVVDDVAQVEIRGASADLRTLSGQPAQWRRFECTGAMPVNPPNFRFSGVDGRGRQQLIRDPRNGGAAVVQIEDKDGGSEGYTFDIFGDARGPNAAGGYPPNNYQDREQRGPVNAPAYGEPDRNRYRPNYRDSEYYRRYNHGFGVEEAIRVCQQAVLNEATRRFNTNDIHFHRTAIDDSPGRDDWVTGTLDIHRGPREERYGFSCSVNFDNGRVRSAVLDPRPMLTNDPRWR